MPQAYSRIILESSGSAGGDAGKDVLATAVTAAIHENHPDLPIIVTSLHPEIWLHNPDIYRVYKIGNTPYFFDDFVKDKKSKIIKLDPRNSSEFITKQKELIPAWLELSGIEEEGKKENSRKKYQPKLFLTQREKEVARKMMPADKPIFLLHLAGEQKHQQYFLPDVLNIDPIMMEKVVNEMLKRGYRVLEVGPKNKPVMRGAVRLDLDGRLLLAALAFTEKRLFTDTVLHHATAALELPSVILGAGKADIEQHYSLHTYIDKPFAIEHILATLVL